jgi:hypothetical protein
VLKTSEEQLPLVTAKLERGAGEWWFQWIRILENIFSKYSLWWWKIYRKELDARSLRGGGELGNLKT